jgi:hypothetical protein
MDFEQFEKRLLRALDRIEEILECDAHRPGRDTRILTCFGATKGVQMANYTILPGATKTWESVFEDANGNQHPLAAVPTLTEPTNTLVIAPVGTQTAQDPSFSWTVQCPATVAPGTAFSVTVSGTNPDGTVDSQTDTVTASTPDDTQVVTTFQ